MTTETQAAFARRQGVNKSTVTRWAQSGRLALDGAKVDVEKSLALLEQTKGDRDDVAERHRLEREEKEAAAGASDVREKLREAALEKARNEGRIKAAQADKLEMERDELAGDLIRKEDVDFVLKDFGALLRNLLDGRAERVGAELGLSPEQVVILGEADEGLLHEVADKLTGREKKASSA